MSERTYFPRTPGKGIEPTADEMKGRIARFNDLPVDPEAFVDHADESRKRRIAWAISPGNIGGPAAISVAAISVRSFMRYVPCSEMMSVSGRRRA